MNRGTIRHAARSSYGRFSQIPIRTATGIRAILAGYHIHLQRVVLDHNGRIKTAAILRKARFNRQQRLAAVWESGARKWSIGFIATKRFPGGAVQSIVL